MPSLTPNEPNFNAVYLTPLQVRANFDQLVTAVSVTGLGDGPKPYHTNSVDYALHAADMLSHLDTPQASELPVAARAYEKFVRGLGNGVDTAGNPILETTKMSFVVHPLAQKVAAPILRAYCLSDGTAINTSLLIEMIAAYGKEPEWAAGELRTARRTAISRLNARTHEYQGQKDTINRLARGAIDALLPEPSPFSGRYWRQRFQPMF